MMTTQRAEFTAVVSAALAEYVKVPTPAELDAWWGTCRVFSLDDVARTLKAHTMDPDDGKRPPRPVDVKRRLASPRRGPDDLQQPEPVDRNSPRMAAYREACILSPSVRATAWAIALRHGNRPWFPDHEKRFELPARQREPGEEG